MYSPIDVDCTFRSAGLFLKIANAALLKIFTLIFCNSLNILQARITFAFMTVFSKQESLCDFAIGLRHACRFSLGYTAQWEFFSLIFTDLIEAEENFHRHLRDFVLTFKSSLPYQISYIPANGWIFRLGQKAFDVK